MTVGSYSAVRVSDLVAAAAARLNDPTFIHWSIAELSLYVREAMRTWSALTASFRNTGILQTQPGVCFYDLTALPNNLCAYTVTDRDIVTAIEYSLLEPANPGVWTGSSQFTLEQITSAVQRRRDQFLRETGTVLTHQVLPVAPPPDGRVKLPETVISISRAAWVDVAGLVYPLLRDDEWGMSAYRHRWPQMPRRPPLTYSVGVTPPLLMQLAPGPLDAGMLDLVGVTRAADLNPAVGVVLGIPDDWSWVVKFGALADLLSGDGLAIDQARASYCELRWQQGITGATLMNSVLSARIANKVLQIRSLHDADSYKRQWQNQTGVEPFAVLSAGPRLIAVPPPPPIPPSDPLGHQYQITLDVVVNCPIPGVDNGFLPIGPELVDPILDYIQHLAMFKDGPDLALAQDLMQRFYRAAGVTLDLNQAMVSARGPLLEQGLQDQRSVPRTLPVEPPVVLGVGER